ncbi:MAG TPA: cell envelope integrity protein TolA [Acidiferrobacterales bacterium]|nr:cell envelope integrity protein TolA [Acidiferrobacterales bacterium]
MQSGNARRLPGGRKAIVYAVLVHLALLALVVVGFRWQAKPAAAPAKVVQAKAVNDAETQKEIERRKKQEREQQERERQAVDEKRRQEQAKIAEQKRKEEDKRKAAEAEKKRKDEARQAEAKKKKDTEERRKSAESSLKEQLAREEKERTEARAKAEQAARAQSELARVEGLIRQKVERNWVRPAGWTRGMECVVRVRLAPTGEVISATIARPSGSPAFDRSVENAVYKASPLPLPEDKGLFEHFRELELRFRPEGQA